MPLVPPPASPTSVGKARPLGAGTVEELARARHHPTFDGAGPSTTITSDARRTTIYAPRTILGCTCHRGRASPGAGGVGEETRHGESRRGSSPTTSSPPAQRSFLSSPLSEPGVRGRHVPASAHSL